jgi:hypothetical protein
MSVASSHQPDHSCCVARGVSQSCGCLCMMTRAGKAHPGIAVAPQQCLPACPPACTSARSLAPSASFSRSNRSCVSPCPASAARHWSPVVLFWHLTAVLPPECLSLPVSAATNWDPHLTAPRLHLAAPGCASRQPIRPWPMACCSGLLWLSGFPDDASRRGSSSQTSCLPGAS